MAGAGNAAPGMVDPAIFEQLQANIDSDAHVREELRNILQKLERQVEEALEPAWPSIVEQANTIKDLADVASKHPYYKYNQIWTRDMQDTCPGGFAKEARSWLWCCVSGLEELVASRKAVCLLLKK
ncbi:MAG: hypothetical protein Q9181_002847 [Wetmoreana brouardii]